MKKWIAVFLCIALFLCLNACNGNSGAQIAATTLPVYQFTSELCAGTPINVTRLVTESVSCLHDYTLTVTQMKAIESAQVVITSGAGLEDFMADALSGANQVIDASANIELLPFHGHHSDGETGHKHEYDPHVWLSPVNALSMAQEICAQLSSIYPEQKPVLEKNLQKLTNKLTELNDYAQNQLTDLSCRDLITFHDGFGYLADAYDLQILHSIEEESGSEASADELSQLIEMVQKYHLPAIFTEANGSTAAASVIAAETGVKVYNLDMAMSGDDYFASMYHNIDTLKEALG